ncbi:MFS transporter [Phycicoccus sp. Root101]|uniref:MFS transporter n=1 Tax=Phycicoccus sp. Root101 TaxID=1736421 RepID=UPI0007033CBE|nr:MFS transporter [Phycicoccus sp. Root101]KQU66387.1 MFS transporter [Phycicoccus sp. Root101]
MPTEPSDPVGPAVRSSHTNLALLALAIGGFAIGTTEFVTMGLLPEVADGVGISIPTAGHVVSAYAAGVVVGAPVLATLGSKMPRKRLLLWLMGGFAVANGLSALASSYGLLMGARFLSGLPHGAYFGVGSLVAASLVPAHRRTWAVSMMITGLTVANIVGVPLTTRLGQSYGWQWPYAAVSVLAAVTVLAVWRWVPFCPPDGGATMRSEFSALRRPQVWFALAIGTVGFGGMFATFSYIAPTMTELGGFSKGAIPLILAVYGVGMTAGAVASGPVSKLGLLRGICVLMWTIAVMLALFGPAVHQAKWLAIVAVFMLGLLPSALVPMLQTRLMDVAHEGQSLAAALNHSTLNLANALGAWLGSIVLSAGLGYEWPSRVGAILAVLGVGIALASGLAQRRTTRRSRGDVSSAVATA